VDESVQADPRSQSTSGELGEIGGRSGFHACHCGQHPRNREAQLGSHAEAGMLGGRVEDGELGGGDWESSVRQLVGDSPGNVKGASGQWTFGAPGWGGHGGELEAWCIDHESDPAELTRRLGAPAQEAEMKPAARLDAEPGHD